MIKPQKAACSFEGILLILVVGFCALSIQMNLLSHDRIVSTPIGLPARHPVVTIYEIVPDYKDTYQYILDQRNDNVPVMVASLDEEIIIDIELLPELPVITIDQVFSSEEMVCMAKNIYFEAKNQSMKGQIAVGLVTLNRVFSHRYPDSVCEVVYARKQFSWYSDGLSDRPRHMVAWEKANLIASALLSTDTSITDFTNGSDHYHAEYVEPEWRLAMVRIMQLETHIFYRSALYVDSTL